LHEEKRVSAPVFVNEMTRGSLFFTALLIPFICLAQQGRQPNIETNCGCSGYYLDDNEALLVPVAELVGPLVNGHVSSGWGFRRNPFLKQVEFHFGLDIAAPLGSPIYAFSNGVVEQARFTELSGNWLLVRYGKKLEVGYSHLASFGPGIKAGTHVKRFDVLGKVGSSGRSTGPHLDIRMYVRGRRVRPECSCGYPLISPQKHRTAVKEKG
jgi:murein DD-endopeptidase MepM/ murein hydrolase activator NlpD